MIRPRLIAAITVCFTTVIALSTLAAGIDYFADCLGIDALIRGNVADFFHMQPMQGPASMVLRAPFVAMVFHADIQTVYYAGLIPCYAALLVLARVLWVRMEGRPTADRVIVAFVCAGSPFVVKAVHWGHPEDLLATGLALGALLVASRGRGVLAGVMLGTAYASKQWAVVAGLPVLLVLPERRWRFLLAGLVTTAVWIVPMILGDPDRFWLVTRDAASAVPGLRLENATLPGVRAMPHSLWMLLASPSDYEGLGYRFAPSFFSPVAHPLMILAGVPPAYALWRRGPVSLISAARLLALALALRCVLDPNDLDYYHVPVVATLALIGAIGGRRDVNAALYATAALSLAFVQPATRTSIVVTHAWLKFAVYMAAMLPLLWWLARDLYDLPPLRDLVQRGSRSPRAHASASSA